jgi:dipeptidyl aminopeptidase/acylaminoacyl peptidase
MTLLKTIAFVTALAGATVAATTAAHASEAQSLAAAFGARVGAFAPALSPDGKFLVYIAPGAGQMTIAVVMNLADGATKPITYADGKPLKLSFCGWAAADRLVCQLWGISKTDGVKLSWSRLVAVNADGTHSLPIGNNPRAYYGIRQQDGEVLDWMAGNDGKVLMARGGNAELVDTRTGVGVPVKPAVGTGWTDGTGTVRIMGINGSDNGGMLNGQSTFWYRLPGHADRKLFSHVDAEGHGLYPLAVDGTRNLAYAVEKKDGRLALYSVALDGTMKTDLVFADPKVDVDSVETIGRHDRVIGLRYVTDKTHIIYFDPTYRALAVSLAKALPALSDISFVSASADEKRLLLFAESDRDAGHYYLFDHDTRKLTEVLVPRAELTGMQLSEQRSITFPATDGTQIPAYLTLPPGSNGKHLPALVMPHGGPASRDVWGFDWLSQYFAQRGFAVIQPEFRGSTGFGEDFENKNGFLSWPTAIGDVTDAGRYLISQGIADPDRLGIFGWSYGGYAALQVNVVDPALFKAVVAVAPVTDLYRLKADAEAFTSARLVAKQVGHGAVREQGSPDHYAARFRAPVLLFHGDQDINVNVTQSRLMQAALEKAGKTSRLVLYPGLDHQLDDSAARTDMLRQADAFFRTQMTITTP